MCKNVNGVCLMDDEWISEMLAGIPSDCVAAWLLNHWVSVDTEKRVTKCLPPQKMNEMAGDEI